MNQRPSRHCIRQLVQKADELEEQEIAVVVIQAAPCEAQALADWAEDQKVPFPVAGTEISTTRLRLDWGVQSLPWLILTDGEHVVRAEGFAPSELDGKIEGVKDSPGSSSQSSDTCGPSDTPSVAATARVCENILAYAWQRQAAAWRWRISPLRMPMKAPRLCAIAKACGLDAAPQRPTENGIQIPQNFHTHNGAAARFAGCVGVVSYGILRREWTGIVVRF